MRRLLTSLLMMLGAALAVRPGDTAPDFSLRDAAGKAVTLRGLRGQPVVLTFWATWCLVCKQELPELNREAARLNLKNMFAVSETDTSEDALAYFKKGALTTIVPLVDAPGTAAVNTGASVARAYRIIGQPVAVFINASGKVTAVHTGYLPVAQFRVYLKQNQQR